MATKGFTDLMEAYVAKVGHPSRAASAILNDLLITLSDLESAEAEIARLRGQISAGYIRRDVSSHYAADWKPKKPLPDAIDDEWVKTGREAA